MMYYYNDFYPTHMFGFGFLGFVFQIFFTILVILLIVAIIKRVAGHRHWRDRDSWFGKDKQPLDILKERYAKGELTKEQFESMKKDLEKE